MECGAIGVHHHTGSMRCRVLPYLFRNIYGIARTGLIAWLHKKEAIPLRKLTYFCIAYLWLALPAAVSAEAYGRFPGLERLVERADVIAVVQIGSEAVRKNGEWINLDDLRAEAGKRQYNPVWGASSGPFENRFASPVHILKTTSETLSREVIQIWAVPLMHGDSPLADTSKLSPEELYLLKHSRKPKTGDTTLLFLTTRLAERNLRRTLSVPGAVMNLPPTVCDPMPEGKTAVEKVRNLLQAAMQSTPKP